MTAPRPDSPRSASKRIASPSQSATVLPKAREGRPPAWPLETECTDGQYDFWKRLWRTPQAAMWERLVIPHEMVAHYILALSAAEGGSIPHAQIAARHADALGLTPVGMARLKWVVAAPVEAEVVPIKSAGPRLRVVD